MRGAAYPWWMSQYSGYPAAPQPPQGAPRFAPPGGSQHTAPIPSGYLGYPYPGPAAPQPQHAGAPLPYLAPVVRRQRPAVIGMAATMTVTASLQWLCLLTFAWLVATAGAAGLSTSDVEGAMYHMLRRFHLRMIGGLALPLYGFPTLALLLGFVILAPRRWPRVALTLTGVATLAWSAWWLRQDIMWWLPVAAYIGFVCLILWTPGATLWYRQRVAWPGSIGAG